MVLRGSLLWLTERDYTNIETAIGSGCKQNGRLSSRSARHKIEADNAFLSIRQSAHHVDLRGCCIATVLYIDLNHPALCRGAYGHRPRNEIRWRLHARGIDHEKNQHRRDQDGTYGRADPFECRNLRFPALSRHQSTSRAAAAPIAAGNPSTITMERQATIPVFSNRPKVHSMYALDMNAMA